MRISTVLQGQELANKIAIQKRGVKMTICKECGCEIVEDFLPNRTGYYCQQYGEDKQEYEVEKTIESKMLKEDKKAPSLIMTNTSI